MKKFTSSLIFVAGVSALTVPASATVFLQDSLVVDTASNPTSGVYQDGNALSAVANRDITGGSTVGYSASNTWTSVGTGVAILADTGVSSNSISGSGGAVSFRGNSTTDNRMAYRQINAYTGPTSTYFGGMLSTNLIDDDAESFIAFSNFAGSTGGNAILSNGVTNFYNGIAFGFKGDGSGNMDLVLRYRTATTTVYADQVLVSGVSVDTAYTVMGRIDWESASTSSREDFTVWVNPDSVTEPTIGGITLTGFLGESGDLNAVYLLQKNFGTSLTQRVLMDEVRLGSSWEDLSPIPEPSASAGLIGLLALGLTVCMRRRSAR